MTSATLPTRRLPRFREFTSSVSTIMSKELRSRFRGRRAFVVLTLYLGVLALIAYGAYLEVAPVARLQTQFGGGVLDGSGLPGANASASIGEAIFARLSIFQLLLIGVLAPAFTTGAISLEREKATLDLLITTPLRPGAIVVGKLLSALGFVVLMILAAIPVSALVLMYGGASVDDILRQQVVLFVSAIGFGVIGLFFSALTKRTQTATVVTYSAILVLMVGTFFIWRFWNAGVAISADAPFGSTARAPEELLYLNPAVAMIEIVADTEITPGDYSTIMAEIRGTNGLVCNGKTCFPPGGTPGPVPVLKLGGAVGNGTGTIDCPPNASCPQPAVNAASNPQPGTGHFWPRFAVTFAGLSLLLTLASMRLVVPAGLAFSFRRRSRRQVPVVEPADPEQTGD
jgi:ABC-type transport system involved in multi-copper enzyme maturation permease subunit